MKTRLIQFFTTLIVCLALQEAAWAKDEPVTLGQCPAAVQTVIQHYMQQATLEEIGLDKDKKEHVYEAKFTLPNGKRIEAHITPDGKVIKFEEKKKKKN